MSQSVIAASASILCKIAEHYKIDPSPIFQQAGLDIGLMRRDPNARYDSADIDKAWSLLAIQIDHPCFALKAADCWHPSDLHALGYAWLSSTSLRSALERLCRYTRIITDMDDFTLHESEESVTVIVENRGLPENVLWAADASMAMLVSMCRVNHGQDFNPLSVEFMHPEPPCASEYYATFRCPLVFNADANCLQLSSQVIDEPLAGANAVL
ncbi:MAG: AraC family transcriptional regulator, partial [Arenicellales bacterium]